MTEGLEIDAGTRIQDVTPRLERFLGAPLSELRLSPLERIIAASDFERVTAVLADLVENGQDVAEFSASLRRPNGDRFPVVMTASRRSDPQDQVTGFTIVVELANRTPAPPPPPAPLPQQPLGAEVEESPNVLESGALGLNASPGSPSATVTNLDALPPPPSAQRLADASAPVQPSLPGIVAQDAAALPPAYRRLPIAAALVGPTGLVIDATDEWILTFGQTADPAGQNVLAICHPNSIDELTEEFAELVAGKTDELRLDARCTSARGQLWCRISGNSIRGEDLFAISIEDITASRAEQRSLVANEALFRTLAETSPVGVARLGVEMVIDYTNPRWRQLTGYQPSDAGVILSDLIDPIDRDRLRDEISDRFNDQSAEPIRCRLQQSVTGTPSTWVSLRVAQLRAPDRGLVGHMAVMEDITDLMRTQESNSQLAGIVESTSNLVGIFDLPSREVRYLNAAAQELFCPESIEVSSLRVSDLYTEASSERYADEIYPVLRRGEAWTGELSMIRPDGEIIQVMQTFTAELDERGNIRRLSTLGQDVTDQVRAHDRLAYQATHDSLTGLPNRSLLIDHMELALARSARDHTPVALLFLDLDRFKQINDTHGHDVGDLLLQELAHRLRLVIRPSDTVARLGGDEFVILADDIEGERDALRISSRVRAAIEDRPFELGDIETHMSASIGIAISNGGASRDAASLLRDADTAMFRAKRGGRARVELFDDALRERTAQRDQLAKELGEALQLDRLVAHFHPMVDLQTGRIVGAEALARWIHPVRGVLPARDFIDIAIDAGLAGQVDAASARHAVVQAAEWHRTRGVNSPVVYINASRHSLEDDRLADLLGQLMATHDLPPHRLCIEVAESIINDHDDDLAARLERFRDLGLGIAVDGVGSSSLPLNQLGRYPLTMLKIDREVTSRIHADGAQLVNGISALANALDLQIGAEGVDEPGMVKALAAAGVGCGQGTAFAAPLPAEQVTPLLNHHFRTV